MKILHINSYFASSGTPTFYKLFFDELVSRGLDIDVLVPVAYGVERSEIKLFGSYTHLIKTHNNSDRYFFFLKQNKILEEAKKMFNNTSFDLIHAHSLFTNGYVANRLHHIFGIPYIVAIRNTDINIFFRFMLHLKKIGIQILREAERVVFINESYKRNLIEKILPKEFKEEVFKKSVVIPNGVDSFWLDNKYSGIRKPVHRDLKILTVGQVSKNKNQISVIRAIELLVAKGFNIHYTIVGAIKDKNLFKKIQKHSFVEYVPHKAKEELLQIYRKADVFVLPSKTETFGLVYAEAMSQSLPVIFTRGQGFDLQFKEGKVGYSVDCENPEEIADRIQDILLNYEAISNNCFHRCEKYNWGNIINIYINIYEQCIQAYSKTNQ